MGLGIAGMHYTGMAAMRGLFVALSLVIAIGASTVALWLAFRTTDLGQKLVAAVVMGVAISGMHYTAMRAAIFTTHGPVHLTRALAVELAPIRVNIVCPGVVKSPLWAAMTEPDRAALYRQTAEKLPVGHVGETAEIAEAYLYLIRQTYGTGQVVVVDGGAALV
jgi:NAD(P)-dependent dehydrogenase (short-subunit alcohol dehydrogenase family)